MNQNEIVFISQNPYKFEEFKLLFDGSSIPIVHMRRELKEIQSDDLKEIVRRKTLDGFAEIGRPVLVDHTGLFIEAWNGMPGGLTQLFWDTLGGERICRMVDTGQHRNAIARTVLGYCDGRKLHIEFEGMW